MLVQAIRFFIFVEDGQQIQILISTFRQEIQKEQTWFGLFLVRDFMWICSRFWVSLSS